MNAWGHLLELGERLRRNGNVEKRQEEWLLNCLARNRDTDYGRLHGFGRMRSSREYRNRVPLVSYEDFASKIMQMERGEHDILFGGLPAAFERTGGSTGGSKLIPYSASSLPDFRAAILPWLADVIVTFGFERGCAYWAISPATRRIELSSAGIPIGLPDGAYLGEEALPAFMSLSAVPPWVGEIPAVEDWRLITLYWLVRRNDLVLFSVWSPTFLLALLDGLDLQRHALERLLREGGAFMGRDLPPDMLAAERLFSYFEASDAQVLWPELKLVSCWTDASSKPLFEVLKRRLSYVNFQGKGLLATEGVVTIPNHEGYPVLAADSGFFEFLDEGGESVLAHELKESGRYEVVMTTAGGLYRYRTGDRVVCEGDARGLPKLRFIGRSGLSSDLVGEKLTDEFVDDCLEGIPGFRMLVPTLEPKPGYVLIMDEGTGTIEANLAESVEARLKRNPQYAYARGIGQLGGLTLLRIPDPLSIYTGRVVAHGVRLGDVKLPALRPGAEWLPIFRGSKA